MSRRYNPQREYTDADNVRDRNLDPLAELIRGNHPEGIVRPLIGARRSGKTWALKALREKLGTDSQWVDLRGGLPPAESLPAIVLLDEPGEQLASSSVAFFDWCRSLRDASKKVVIAVTPLEWSFISKGDAGRVRDADYSLGPMSVAEADLVTEGDSHGRAWANALEPDWRRNPFLLKLVLDTIDGDQALTRDPKREVVQGFQRRAIERALDSNSFDYVGEVFERGLDPAHQDCLRSVARGRRIPKENSLASLLKHVGLLSHDSNRDTWRIADPVLAYHLPPPLRIHHISDVHCGAESAMRVDNKVETEGGRVLASAVGQGEVRTLYLERLEALTNQGIGPHLVLVSGDLTERGTDQEFADAKSWLEKIQDLVLRSEHPRLSPGEPRIALVGGNHDVDWGSVRCAKGHRERHVRFGKVFDGWRHPRLELAPSERPVATVRWEDAGIEVLLLGSAEFGGEVDEEIERVLEGLEELRKEAIEVEGADPTRAAKLRDRLARSDPGLVHGEDLKRARGHNWTMPVRLAVLHHPLSSMPSPTEVARFAGLLNAGAIKQLLFEKEFCLVLHGHVHKAWLAEERWPSILPDRCLRIAAAPSLGSKQVDEPQGYNEIEIFREGDRFELTVTTIQRNGDAYSSTARPMGPFTPCRS